MKNAQLLLSSYCIQCKNFKTNNAHKVLYKNAEQTKRSYNDDNQSANRDIKVFDVMAAIGVDNYQLLDKASDNFIEMAYIPNFTRVS